MQLFSSKNIKTYQIDEKRLSNIIWTTGQSMIEYVLLFAVFGIAIAAGSSTLFRELRCEQVPQAFCRATKAMILDKKGQELQTEMNKCRNLDVCDAQ